MKYMALCYWIIVVLISCNNESPDCSIKEFNFANQKYQAKGCLNNNIEDGEWFFYNEKNQILENGFYDRGLRIGKWHYPQNKKDSIITWRKYEKYNLHMIFSIPVLLVIVEDGSDYIKFSNKDSSELFNVVLSVHDIEKREGAIKDYYKHGEKEIKDNEWNFKRTGKEIAMAKEVLYFNEYYVNSEIADFKVLNAYSLTKDKKVFEISCRYDKNIESSAMIIFFSLLTNSFYADERLVNPFSEIKAVTTY
jgi:antitoxin component YwqK of YwqJK toxin-antitoxin module